MLKLSDRCEVSSVIYQLPLLSSAAFPYLQVKCWPGLNRYRLRPSQATAAGISPVTSEDSALFLSLLPPNTASHDDNVTSDI